MIDECLYRYLNEYLETHPFDDVVDTVYALASRDAINVVKLCTIMSKIQSVDSEEINGDNTD